MTNVCRFFALAVALGFCLTTSGMAQESAEDSSEVLSTLDKNHPRLMLKDKDLGRILRHFHAADKPTALICHGPIALLSARDGEDWPYQGYRVTVFSNVEEKIGEDDGAFGGKLKIYPENALSDAGARVINQEKPWQVSVIQDRELITAQNPMSGHKFADVFVENLKGQ